MSDYEALHYTGDIEEVLTEHQKWLNSGGDEGTQANLRHADLRHANLGHADLGHADLRHADLGDADLRHANLWDADLGDAELRHANLGHADLGHAELRHAELRHADLRAAELRHADLWDAEFEGAELPVYERLPETGDFHAYKGCMEHVVEVRVPGDAARTSSLKGPKCRAEYVEVVEVFDGEGGESSDTEACSWYDEDTVYREGETVYPDSYDPDFRVECSNGIHIYPTVREAVEAVQR